MTVMTLILLTAFSSQAFEVNELEAISPNNAGVEALKKENSYGAYKNFLKAIETRPFDPAVRLNLGLAYQLNKENEKAVQEYRLADQLAAGQPDVQFMARFNQGAVLAQAGDIAGALTAYQSALEIKPDSLEVKTNIELLWQNQSGGKGQQKQDDKSNQSQNQDQDQKQNQNQNQDQQKQAEQEKKPQPKPFDSRELTPDTVRKILEEIKAQEERVRADQYAKGAKEQPRAKDW